MIQHQSIVTANGNYFSVPCDGGPVRVIAQGTWASATVTLQISTDHGDWVTAETALSADGVISSTKFFHGSHARLVVASGTASTNLKLSLAT